MKGRNFFLLFLMIFMFPLVSENVDAGFFDAVGDAVSNVASSVGNAVQSTANTISDGINDAVDTVTDGVESTVDSITDSVKDIPVLGPIVSGTSEAVGFVVNGVVNGVGTVLNTGTQIISGTVNLVTGNFGNVGQSLSNMGDSFADFFDDAFNGLGGMVNHVFGLAGDITSFIPWVGGYPHDFFSLMGGGINAAFEATGDWINGDDWMSSFINTLMEESVDDLSELYIEGIRDVNVHFKTGRIYGRSLSDVSSYLHRATHFNEMGVNDDALVLIAGNDKKTGTKEIMKSWWEDAADWKDNKNHFSSSKTVFGYNNVFGKLSRDGYTKFSEYIDDFESKSSVFYSDHGDQKGFPILDANSMGDRNLKFSNSFFVVGACEMGAFTYSRFEQENLFSPELLSRGAMNVVSAVSISMNLYYFDELIDFKKGQKTVGGAFRRGKNSGKASPLIGLEGDDYCFVLYGDPTLRQD